MKNLIRLEEILMLALAVYLNGLLPYPGWWYWAFFLAPDIGIAGYAINTRVGAFTYNLLHHKGLAVALYLIGAMAVLPLLQFAGLVLFGHSSFDRMLGYGLKFGDRFQNTHLGAIGKA